MAAANTLAPNGPRVTLASRRGLSQRSSLRMLSPLEFAAATLIMAIGSAFQAAVGLGLALLVVPFLALIDMRFVPGPMLFAGIAPTVATAWRDHPEIDRGQLGLSLIGLTIGTGVGAIALTFVAPAYF